MIFCPNCGKQLPDDATVCDACGAKLSAEEPAEKAAPAAEEAPAPAAEKKSGGFTLTPQLRKILLIACVACVAVIILIIILVNVCKSSEPESCTIYKKDTDYFFTDLEGEGKKINIKGNPGSFYVSEDMKYVFYKAYDKDSGSFLGIYRSSTKSEKDEPIKVCSVNTKIHISEDANLVTFIQDGKLYQFNCKKDEKSESIASDVTAFNANDDGGAVTFLKKNDDNTYTWWYKKGSSDAVKVGSSISIEEWSDDLSRVVYTKSTDTGKDLYWKKCSSDDETKIDSNVGNTIRILDDDLKKIYYTKTVKKDDKDVTVLYKWDGGDESEQIADKFSGFEGGVYEDGEFYFWKSEEIDNASRKVLYYFDGKEVTKISDAKTINVEEQAAGRPVLVFTTKDSSEQAVADVRIAIEEEVSKLSLTDNKWDDLTISADGKVLFVIDDTNDKGIGTLKKFKLGSTPSDPDTIGSDVSVIIGVTEDNDVYYKKDVNSTAGTYTLWINDKKANDDVSTTPQYCDGKFYYFVDKTTLMVSSGKEGKKIKEDIIGIQTTKDGKVVAGDKDKNFYYVSGTSLKLIAKDVSDSSGILYSNRGENAYRYYNA